MIRKHRGKAAAGLVIIALLGWLVYLYRDQLDGAAFIEFGRRMPAGWFLVALFVLPIVGMPITPVLVLAGARFGFGWGAGVTAVAMAFHSVAAYRLTRGWLRGCLRGWLEKRGYRIPRMDTGDQTWFTALTAATPGPPYAAKLLLLGMTDIRLPTYFWAGTPVYFLFGLVPVGAGSALINLSAGWVPACAADGVLLTGTGRWLAAKHSARAGPGRLKVLSWANSYCSPAGFQLEGGRCHRGA